MEIQFKKHVRIICALDEGDHVTTVNWGPRLDGKVHIIEKVIPAIGSCESGFMIKLHGDDSTYDSGWFNIEKKHNG
jgi:hypothetical protein